MSKQTILGIAILMVIGFLFRKVYIMTYIHLGFWQLLILIAIAVFALYSVMNSVIGSRN